MMNGRKVLVVDDDEQTLDLLKVAFERMGAKVLTAHHGQEGLRKLFRYRPQLVVLDVMMPGMSGWDVLRRIREVSDVPVLLLTVKAQDEDMLRGFSLGADDYVVKPFNLKLLQARARALLGRAATEREPEERDVYDDGYLRVELEAQRVRVEGRPTNLTPTEFNLLACLLRRRGRVCTYEQILNQVWNDGAQGSIEAVHAFVWQVRQKIEPNPREPLYLTSVRGVGYRFEPPAA